MLNVSTHGGNSPANWRRGGEAASRNTSVQGRRSGEILGITEEDEEEDEDGEEFVEEVDDFRTKLAPGEFVEEGSVSVLEGKERENGKGDDGGTMLVYH
jgi:hypothetical protein